MLIASCYTNPRQSFYFAGKRGKGKKETTLLQQNYRFT
jgi:hypothetical protein